MKTKFKNVAVYSIATAIVAILLVLLLGTPRLMSIKDYLLVKGSGSSNTNYYSKSDGNWSSSSTWDGSRPGSVINDGDTVFIRHNVTFPNDLTIYGVMVIEDASSLSNNGNKDVTINNLGTMIVYGNLEVEDLTINTGGTMVTYGAISVEGDFENNGTLQVETTDDYTGSLMIEGTTSGSSDMIFNRYIQSDGWHYISSPISSASMNVLWGGAVYSYDETLKSWNQHGADEAMENMKGYDVYFKSSGKTIVFAGSFNEGAFSMNLTNTPEAGDGYNLVGNPYPTAIDWDASSGWTKTNVSDAIYVWDDETQNITTYFDGVGINGGSNIIPPTMAFFVKCTQSSGVLGMDSDVRVSSTNDFRSSTPKNILKLRLEGSGYGDEMAIRFKDEASLDYEESCDAEKIFSYNVQVPQLYMSGSQNDMAINSIPYTNENISIPVFYTAKVATTYSLSLDESQFDFELNILLEDLETNEVFDLKQGPYEFESENVKDDRRFILHLIPFQSITQESGDTDNTTDIDESDASEFQVHTQNKTIYIEPGRSLNGAWVKIFDTKGREVKSSKFVNNITNSIDMGPVSGLFIVSIIENGRIFSQKVLIR